MGLSVKDNKDRFHFRFTGHRNYTESKRYFSDLVVKDMDYALGPYYLALIESTGIPVNIRASVRNVKDKNPGRFLKRLLSERKAELRLSGTSISGNENLKRQISDLEKVLYQYESDGVKPANVSFTFRIFSQHPAILNENVNRIVEDLGMMGIRVEQVASSKRSVLDFASPGANSRRNYLMNTRQAASMLPIFREPEDAAGGMILGVDDLTERFVRFNPFTQNSYNILVVGETGSGKSYFGKLFLSRSLESGLPGRAIVFDPLDEYFCGSFGGSCSEVDIHDFIAGFAGLHSQDNQKHNGAMSERVTIVKADPEDLESEEIIYGLLKGINFGMTAKPDLRKLIVIDECHIILRSQRNAKALGQMIRHSRHYNTGIVNISQNADDFLSDRTNSIAFNSNRIFIFRTRNLREGHKKVLKLDDFEVDPPERLLGGKMHPYSECLMTDGEFCRKLRILSTDSEDRGFSSSELR